MFRKNDEFRIDIIETKLCTYFKFLQPIHNTFLQISGKKITLLLKLRSPEFQIPRLIMSRHLNDLGIYGHMGIN